MRILAALLLVMSFAAPSPAGELLRYRAPDGSIGFLDDERRLPLGAEVLSRTPRAPRPAPAASPEAAASAAALEPGEGGDAVPPAAAIAPEAPSEDCHTYTDVRLRTRCWTERGALCSHFGMVLRCAPEEIAAAETWCERGESLREDGARVAAAFETAHAKHQECERRSGLGARCPRAPLETATRNVEVWELRMEALETQCQDAGCLPGWVRESCRVQAAR